MKCNESRVLLRRPILTLTFDEIKLTAMPPGPSTDDPVDVVVPPQVAHVNQIIRVITNVLIY